MQGKNSYVFCADGMPGGEAEVCLKRVEDGLAVKWEKGIARLWAG